MLWSISTESSSNVKHYLSISARTLRESSIIVIDLLAYALIFKSLRRVWNVDMNDFNSMRAYSEYTTLGIDSREMFKLENNGSESSVPYITIFSLQFKKAIYNLCTIS